MLDAVDTVIAAHGALRAMDEAARIGADVPRMFGKRAALEATRAYLLEAESLISLASSTRASDAALATAFLDASNDGIRAATAVAQSRSGAEQLDTLLESPRPILKEAIARLELFEKRDVAARLSTREAATATAATLFDASYDEMDAASWRRLANIASLPEHIRPEGLAHPDGASIADDLQDIANLVETGSPVRPTSDVWRIVNRLRADATYPARADADARVAALLDMPNRDLDRQDLDDLDGLVQLAGQRRPSLLAQAGDDQVAAAARLRATIAAIDAEWADPDQLARIGAALTWPTREAATVDAAAALGSSFDDMSPASWRRLADVALLPPAVRPAGLAHATGGSISEDLRESARRVEAGASMASDWPGWRGLNRLRADAAYATMTDAQVRLAELVELPHGELTRQDLHDLDGLLQLPTERQPRLLAGATLDTAAGTAEQRGMGQKIDEDWEGWALLGDIRARSKWPTREAALADLSAVIGSNYDDMTVDDWSRLADLASLPAEIRPAGLDYNDGFSLARELRDAANKLRNGKAINERWTGWRVLNRVRAEATYTTRELAESRLRELSTRGRDALTRQDLHDLDGLTQLPLDVRPPQLHDTMLTTASVAAERRGSGGTIEPAWHGYAVLDAMALEGRLPPGPAGRAEWVRTQLQTRLATGDADPLLGTVLRLRRDLVPADLSDIARIPIANEMLRHIAAVGDANTDRVKVALEVTRQTLDTMRGNELSPVERELVERTDELARVNLGRIAGDKSPNGGFLNYTDMADIGRIRSNVELLERLQAAASELAADTTPATRREALTW